MPTQGNADRVLLTDTLYRKLRRGEWKGERVSPAGCNDKYENQSLFGCSRGRRDKTDPRVVLRSNLG